MNILIFTILAVSISGTLASCDKITTHYTNKYIILSQMQQYIDRQIEIIMQTQTNVSAVDPVECQNVSQVFFEGSTVKTSSALGEELAALHRKFINPVIPSLGINTIKIMSPQTKKNCINACKERTPIIKRVNRAATIGYYSHQDLLSLMRSLRLRISNKQKRCQDKLFKTLHESDRDMFLRIIEKTRSYLMEQKTYDQVCTVLHRKKELIKVHNKFFHMRPPLDVTQGEQAQIFEDLYDLPCVDSQISDIVQFQNKHGITQALIQNAQHVTTISEHIQTGQLFSESVHNKPSLGIVQSILNQKARELYAQNNQKPIAAFESVLSHLHDLLLHHQDAA